MSVLRKLAGQTATSAVSVSALGPAWGWHIARLASALLWGWAGLSLMLNVLEPRITFHSNTGEWLGVSLSAAIFFLYARRIYLAPFKVVLDEHRMQLKSWNVLGLRRIVELANIRGFSETGARSRIGAIHGCLIYPINGRALEVNNRCVTNVPELLAFLNRHGVRPLGQEVSTFAIDKWTYRY